MSLFRATMLAAVVLSLPACANRVEVPSEPARPKNVILVLVDTLRADHTSINGYPRPTTPILELLAEEKMVFDHARSQAGCTFPSMNSLLTSRYPFDFYRREPRDMGIPDEYPSFAVVLKAHGYFTAAVSADPSSGPHRESTTPRLVSVEVSTSSMSSACGGKPIASIAAPWRSSKTFRSPSFSTSTTWTHTISTNRRRAVRDSQVPTTASTSSRPGTPTPSAKCSMTTDQESTSRPRHPASCGSVRRRDPVLRHQARRTPPIRFAGANARTRQPPPQRRGIPH